jgi:predicted ATPase
MSPQGTRDHETAWAFGPFRLLRAERLLLDGHRRVPLGGRATDLLIALLERAGDVVSRDELTERVWPESVVDETSLRVHIAALRKALGDDAAQGRFILNVPRRGYRFVAPVHAAAPVPIAPHNLPVRTTRLFGRDDALRHLAAQVPSRRLVTITGPGGMGKTTLALALAESVLPLWRDGVRFVDLASVADPRLLAAAVAALFDLSVPLDDPLPPLAAFLHDRHLLFVIDNCEHLVEAVATFAEQLLRLAPSVHILATSREPLQAEGESVHRVAALDIPPDGDGLTAAGALVWPAVQLFVERATSFTLDDGNAPLVRDLCRRLDGIPLAIEFAAARVETLGLADVARQLGGRLRLLGSGRRPTQPRHRTLRTMLDWSHDLLPPSERDTLHRLSVFRSAFPLDAAVAVAGEDRTAAVLNLVSKSLVSTDGRGTAPLYRLLVSTRDYAAEKLAAGPHARDAHHRHARHLRHVLAQSERGRYDVPRRDWLLAHARLVDDVRAAVAWCFSEPDAVPRGVELTGMATLLMGEMGLLDEYRPWVDRALRHVQDPAMELRLLTTRSMLGSQSVAPVDPAAGFERARHLAKELGDPTHRIAPFHGVWSRSYGTGDYRAALAAAHAIGCLADESGNPMTRLMADRLVGMTSHYLGEHARSRQLVERVLDAPSDRVPLSYVMLSPRGVAMRIVLSRSLWIEGRVDEAWAVAQAGLALAESENPYALAQMLGSSLCPLALWRGDLDAARHHVQRLADHARRHSSPYWQSWAHHYGIALARIDAPGAPIPEVKPGSLKELDSLATVSDVFATPEAFARNHRGDVGWGAAEVFRRVAERHLAEGDPAAARALFDRSLAVARAQGALSWELRTATSLTRWNRSPDHLSALAAVLDRFTQGEGTADLRAARALLG